MHVKYSTQSVGKIDIKKDGLNYLKQLGLGAFFGQKLLNIWELPVV